MKDYKKDWKDITKENKWDALSKVTDDNEILRIVFYKTPNGIKAESRGMVKGVTDLTAVSSVLSDVLNTSIKMMGEERGFGSFQSENKSGRFSPNEWDEK